MIELDIEEQTAVISGLQAGRMGKDYAHILSTCLWLGWLPSCWIALSPDIPVPACEIKTHQVGSAARLHMTKLQWGAYYHSDKRRHTHEAIAFWSLRHMKILIV